MKSLINTDSPFIELAGYHLEVLRLVKPKYIKNKTILDVGCGFGWSESVFLKFNPKKIVGIDPSDECLKVARNFKHPLCKFKKGSAIKLPFKDNTFDTVMSWEVLEHIPKNTEEKMFSEIFRVLKPGGNLFLSTQYGNFFATILDPAWWLIGHRHYKKTNIQNFAHNSGFRVTQIYSKGGIFTIVGTLNLYFSKWILRRNRLFNNFFIQKTKEEYSKSSGIVNVFLHCIKP